MSQSNDTTSAMGPSQVPFQPIVTLQSPSKPDTEVNSHVRQISDAEMEAIRRHARKPDLAKALANRPIAAGKPSTSNSSTTQPSKKTSIELATADFETCKVWKLNFARFTMKETLKYLAKRIETKQPTHVITANLNFAMLCEENRELTNVAQRADLILCDGNPILYRSRLSVNPLPERVAGSDLIYRLSEQSAELGHRIYLLGAAEGVAQKAANELCRRYPNLQIAGVECPPFRELTSEEQSATIRRVRESRTDILLVAFGQPKGELWIDRNLAQLQVSVCIQLGASFDFVAGTAKRAPVVWQRLSLEWLYRACSEPRRLVPRYWKNFVYLVKTLRREILEATQERSVA